MQNLNNFCRKLNAPEFFYYFGRKTKKKYQLNMFDSKTWVIRPIRLEIIKKKLLS